MGPCILISYYRINQKEAINGHNYQHLFLSWFNELYTSLLNTNITLAYSLKILAEKQTSLDQLS